VTTTEPQTQTQTETKDGKTVEFYFDVGSPAAYLAWTQLPRLCAETGAALVWKPMLLGGVFQAIGNRSPAEIPGKGAYLMRDLARHAARYGVPWVRNPHFPIHTLLLMRGATGFLMHEPARLDAYLGAVMRAMWVEPRDLNDPAEVVAMLQSAGFDTAAVSALATRPDVKDRLKATTGEAVARGVFGAPTMFVGDAMFWGQDRLDFVREALGA
jgi:2-hydroxychromene-2-carboxylate isomerase